MMTKEEIQEWRKSIVVQRMYHFLGRLGINSSNISQIDLCINSDANGILTTNEFKVFLQESLKPIDISGDEVIPHIIGKLKRIIEDTEQPVTQIYITTQGYNSYSFKFNSITP